MAGESTPTREAKQFFVVQNDASQFVEDHAKDILIETNKALAQINNKYGGKATWLKSAVVTEGPWSTAFQGTTEDINNKFAAKMENSDEIKGVALTIHYVDGT